MTGRYAAVTSDEWVEQFHNSLFPHFHNPTIVVAFASERGEIGRFGVFVNSDWFKAPLTFRLAREGATAPRQENDRGRASRVCAVADATLKRASCVVGPVARPLAVPRPIGKPPPADWEFFGSLQPAPH